MLKPLKKIVSLALVGAAGFGYASEQNFLELCKRAKITLQQHFPFRCNERCG
jgi:hypothetical protein